MLNATWEADQCNDTSKYKKYALETINELEKYLNNITPDNHDYWSAKLLIPNLYRRIGDFTKAQNHLEHIENNMPKDENIRKNIELTLSILKDRINNKDIKQTKIKK